MAVAAAATLEVQVLVPTMQVMPVQDQILLQLRFRLLP
jgi:hypothetical protein